MGIKIISKNKKAFHDYSVIEKMEVGHVLTGDEVKSLRAGHVNMTSAFATINQGELFMINCHISPYDKAYDKTDDASKRTRKLLVHRRELTRLVGDVSCKGITLIPLCLYFNDKNKVKLELGLCKHRNAEGKKQLLKERDIKRETDREMKNYH